MTYRAICVTGGVLLCCLMAVAWGQDTVTAHSDEVRTLMVERRDVLKKRAQAVDQEFQALLSALRGE